ncbi:replication protein RepA [Nocardia yamanashiensis]|uniref:replication protein RepA n=1 Tax=Nocardia yamanashiensis TaxID=209247 RepID=UPI00082F51C1|nr:replication protein RepA [Nocardia yamanashiensis]
MSRARRSPLDIVRAAAGIWDGEQEVGYLARVFTQTSLPYRDPGDVPAWGRRNGDLSLTVQPGMTTGEDNKPMSVGYPYGTMPRLILTFLSTEAVRTRSPEIVLGDSLTDFMASMGLTATGGKNGSLTRMRAQSHRLFNATLTIEYKGDANRRIGAKLNVASAYNIWCGTESEDDHPSLFSSTVRLSDEFFREVTAHPVPLDINAIKALGGSALRLDIYAWLTYRMFSVKHETTVPWESLMVQFGSVADTSDRRRRHQFRRDFTEGLRQVLVVYPQANVDTTDTGVILRPGLTHIPVSPGFRALARV